MKSELHTALCGNSQYWYLGRRRYDANHISEPTFRLSYPIVNPILEEYAIQAEMNITMSMRLSYYMTFIVTSNLSLNIANSRNAILHHNIHLILRHTKVVVILQVFHRSEYYV